MKIHREGFVSIAVAGLSLIVLNKLAARFVPSEMLFRYTLGLVSAGIFFLVVSFFRVPNRVLTIADGRIISPADGKVVVIEEVFDAEYFKAPRLQISVFMSPLNVHVNRNVIDGEVVYSQYHPGKYLVAWHPKSSTLNEHHTVVIQNGTQQVLVKQIAGALARRIVNYLSVGQSVKQTTEMGFIKFGSRVDVLLPLSAKPLVSINQVVQGGVTVLAELA